MGACTLKHDAGGTSLIYNQEIAAHVALKPARPLTVELVLPVNGIESTIICKELDDHIFQASHVISA